MRNAYKFYLENLIERDCLEDLGQEERILKVYPKKLDLRDMDWIQLA